MFLTTKRKDYYAEHRRINIIIFLLGYYCLTGLAIQFMGQDIILVKCIQVIPPIIIAGILKTYCKSSYLIFSIIVSIILFVTTGEKPSENLDITSLQVILFSWMKSILPICAATFISIDQRRKMLKNKAESTLEVSKERKIGIDSETLNAYILNLQNKYSELQKDFVKIEANINSNEFSELCFQKNNNEILINEKALRKLWMNNDDRENYIKKMEEQLFNRFKKDPNEMISSYLDELYEYTHIINKKRIKLAGQYKLIYSDAIKDIDNIKKYISYGMDLQKKIQESFKEFYSVKESSHNGLEGERKVDERLKLWAGTIDNLSSINLTLGDNNFECDNILLSPYGIFILEVKNIGSSGRLTYKIDKDGRWTIINKFAKVPEGKIKEDNPTIQNDRHIALLHDFLKEKTGKNYDIFGMVVIANVEADIINESDQIVVRETEIFRQMQKFDKNTLTEQEMKEIKEVIMNNLKEARKFPVLDFNVLLLHNSEVLAKYCNELNELIEMYCEKLDEVFK